MIKGFGLHTGCHCEVRLFKEEGPVRFRKNKTFIPAKVNQVTATHRCTVLGVGRERIALVEHLLAALYIEGWWQDLVIEVTGEELPILDGSAQGWLEPIKALGTAPEPPEPLTLQHPIRVKQDVSLFSAKVGASSLKVNIDFDHPAIGQQSWSGTAESYQDLLSARTFGFLSELDYLQKQGLASHASLENAIVFDSMAAMQALRFDNEPVRHKALDALGDLFLLGRPLQAQLDISRGSHALHVAFVQEVNNLYKQIRELR